MRPVGELEHGFSVAFQADKRRYLDEAEGRKKGDGSARPEPPVHTRLCLDEATVEAMYRVKSENRRGVMLGLDELATLIQGLGQYKQSGGGNDRAQFLKMWSNAPVTIDRVLNEFREPIRIPHPMLSIVGNLPPDVLADMLGRRKNDGFMDRWLFAFPDLKRKLKSSERRPVSNEALRDWSAVVDALWRLEMDAEDPARPNPRTIYFSNAGRSEFDRLFDEHIDEVNDVGFPDHLRGVWGKLELYASRFCLILTVLNHAADPVAASDTLALAGEREARDAWRMVDYFKVMHRRVRAFLEGNSLSGSPEAVRPILRWFNNHLKGDSFSERDLTRSHVAGGDRANLEDGLAWLAQRHVIRRRPEPDRPKGTRGPKPTPVWEIHPEYKTSHISQGAHKSPRNPSADRESSDSANTANYAKVRPGEDEEGGGDGGPAL